MKAPATFRNLLTRNLIVTVSFVVGFLLAVHLAPIVLGTWSEQAPSAELTTTPPARPSKTELLVERHDCWTGEAPHDVDMPGHVVVTTSKGVTRYAGPRMVHLALDQIFASVDHGLTVHAFCR